ncbi:hypothetical protein [Cryobacterium sp. 10I5]|uniref:hypothetical protein n=1 Tax=Cryobacterium sp. 10I5 TaxID=3048581 RepID=UPI002B23BC4D|nr:hypothetical protein [Cryobacterium sp. 10I5]MEB0265073.1 hypothetical protein [Cryobacterium sp. 10I5]
MTVQGTQPLVDWVNDELSLIGAEFVTAMTKPAGPFSSVVYGSIDGHLVRLNFLTEPATGMCAVFLVSNQDTLPDRSSAATFQEAIQNYEWAVAVDALSRA